MEKIRLDAMLVERGLAADIAMARRLVMAGEVRVAGQVALQPAERLPINAEIMLESGPRFASRGGEKLEAALGAFGISPLGQVCADVGASTGGFTDCLLQHGAAQVYAIDVGHGILAWKLRQNPRVKVMEGINARGIDRLPEAVSLISIDTSFISLKILLPVVHDWLPKTGGQVVALIKPQFEAEKREVTQGKGVIRDSAIHRRVLLDILAYAHSSGFAVRGLVRSPLLGPKGNAEFLAWFVSPGTPAADGWLESLINQVIPNPDQLLGHDEL